MILDNYPNNKKQKRLCKCGNIFEVEKSNKKENKRMHCSLGCLHDVKKTEKETAIACAICGSQKNIRKNLCKDCKKIVEKDKKFWDIVIPSLLSKSKIVEKEWGFEIHIVNHEEYCLKYLVFFKDKEFSHHYHKLKKELWHCIYGKFECVLEHDNQKEYFDFNKNDKLEIERGVIHQLHALENSILVEVSTTDYPEDSIRIFSGKNN